MLAVSIGGIFNLIVWGGFGMILAVQFLRSVRLVPTKKAYMVERLGRYTRTLGPGFHWLLPFVEQVDSIVDLREETIDVPPQECFTRDEVGVQVDGVLYIEVVEPEKAVYGITDYRFAAVQLAQTTTRSIIGTIDLDRSFEERDLISSKVVEELAAAGQAWGIRVHRYEIRNIAPPPSVRNAMEKQVTAERDRKAIVHRAEGDRQAAINKSEGDMIEMINQSQGAMQRRINEAEGRASEIRALADATAESIERIAAALSLPGGQDAVRLRLTERYLRQLRKLRSPDTKILLPADLSNLNAMLANIGLRDDQA
jgi:regulator of protease activity HflC (stomatin/prohibitin superfamily)